MMRRMFAAGLVAVAALAPPFVQAQPAQGPSSSRPAYVVPTANGWATSAILTTGDAAGPNGYRLAGLTDGLGVMAGQWSSSLRRYVDTSRYLTVFMNHEFKSHFGVARAHGTAGAFVSQWTIDLQTLRVTDGEDLIRRVMTWNGGAYQDTTGATVFDRFCSGDLPKPTAFRDPATGRGTGIRLYLNAEEADVDGRVFAHVISGGQKGTSYELPYLGKAKWENALAHPASGAKTVVVMLNDAAPGQVYVYVGDKQSTGHFLDRAGLQRGKLYGVKVVDGGPNYGGNVVRIENGGAINGRFSLVDLSAHALASSAALDTASDQAAITEFARPEDGHWDPRDPRSFYFNVTGSGGQSARLYRLRFDGTTWPANGSIELVVDAANLVGTDGQVARGFDNMVVNSAGVVVLQEDGGSEAYLSKAWQIRPGSPPSSVQVLTANPQFFSQGGGSFRTNVEELSGVIEVTTFVKGAPWFDAQRRYYLGDIMDHSASQDRELMQGGQLYLFSGPK